MDYINDLYDLCEIVTRAIAEANEKLMHSGGGLNGSDADYIDKLTHTLKSIKTTIAMEEAQGERGGWNSYRDGGGSYRGGSSYREGGNYSREGGSYRDGGSSYARRRGRGRNARRDNMGRYASASEEMRDKLREMMESADEQDKEIIRGWMQDIEK